MLATANSSYEKSNSFSKRLGIFASLAFCVCSLLLTTGCGNNLAPGKYLITNESITFNKFGVDAKLKFDKFEADYQFISEIEFNNLSRTPREYQFAIINMTTGQNFIQTFTSNTVKANVTPLYIVNNRLTRATLLFKPKELVKIEFKPTDLTVKPETAIVNDVLIVK